MATGWLLAPLHLLGVGLAFVGIVTRAWLVRGPLDPIAIQRLLRSDNVWGISALVLISTGLLRGFAGFEKGTAYYLGNTVFWIKMGLLASILLLELFPMVTLIRWRIALARGATLDTSSAGAISRISVLQTVLLAAMIFAASAMARGIG